MLNLKQCCIDEKFDSYDLVSDYMDIMEIRINGYSVMDDTRTELVQSLIFDTTHYLENK